MTNDYRQVITTDSPSRIIRRWAEEKIEAWIKAGDFPKIDSLDLELQTAIAPTVFDIKDCFTDREITKEAINRDFLDQIIRQQAVVILSRYQRFSDLLLIDQSLTPRLIFRNKSRYWFHLGKIYAVEVADNGWANKNRAIEIVFRPVDQKIAVAIEECFHYIHTPRKFDLAFGLFIKGGKVPFAISTVEFIKNRDGENDYKKEFLSHVGVPPEACADEIRLFAFRWAPMMTSSLLAKLVKRHLFTFYPEIKFTLTAVNTNLFNGKYITEAGYRPLFLKPTIFTFEQLGNETTPVPFYQGNSGRFKHHQSWKLLPTIEYWRNIRGDDIQIARKQINCH